MSGSGGSPLESVARRGAGETPASAAFASGQRPVRGSAPTPIRPDGAPARTPNRLSNQAGTTE